MTLKELIDGVMLELRVAGVEETGASLSVAFEARKGTDGTISCEFVDAAALGHPKPEALHRLDVRFSAEPEVKEKAEKKQEPVRIRLRDESAMERLLPIDDLDTPAIYRAAAESGVGAGV